MAITRANSFVSFKVAGSGGARIMLTLSGDWTISGGLAPDVNTATAPYTEVAKLGSNLNNVIGSIEFWSTETPFDDGDPTPDVVRNNIWLVDVKPAGLGKVGGTMRVYEYALSFADHRIAFAEPRGGRLFKGRLNPDPLGDATLYTVEELMDMCRTAMGDTGGVPGTVNVAEPPRDVDWNGAHAPSELDRLLQLSGHVYAPQSNGFGAIVLVGSGSLPTIAEELRIYDVASLIADRRPGKLVFTSAPTAVTRSYNKDASSPPAWEWVIQDPDDGMRWKLIADLSFDALDQLHKGFPDVDEKHRKHVDEQLYRCIRLDVEKFPPLACAVLREVLLPDGTRDEPHIEAEIAIEEDGTFTQRVRRLQASKVEEGNVLVFEHRLGRLPSGVTAAPAIDPVFVPLTAGQLKPTFSVEGYIESAGTKEFAAYGFSFVLGSFSTMSDSTARSHLTGFRPDTAVLCDADLRVVWLNDATSNVDEMRSRAESRAEPLLAGTGEARTIAAKTFVQVELSGRVSAIRYNQAECKTTIVVGGWAAPSGATSGEAGGATPRGGRAGGSGARELAKQSSRSIDSAERKQQATAQRRGTGIARTDVGVTKRVGDPGPKGRRVSVELMDKVAGQAGRYNGRFRSGKLKLDATGNLVAGDVGDRSAADDCIVWLMPDIRLGVHSQIITGTARPVLRGDLSGSIDEASGKPIVVVSTGDTDLWLVDLVQTGGSAGNATTAATFTYTAKRRGTDVATAVPVVMQRPKGKTIAAQLGLLIVADDGAKKIVWCDETPDTGGCA
jgi:hypothetical protein